MATTKPVSINMVAISALKMAKYNPKSRTEDVGGVLKSIERVGLLVPILITDKNEVVDGHRRVAAAKKLGWTEIPAIVAIGEQADMYSEVNSTPRRLTGNQAIWIYLEEPRAVSTMQRNRIEELESAVGRRTVERMAKEGFSLSTWAIAKRVADAADIDDQDAIVGILRWLMKYRCAQLARRALQLGTAPSKLIAAVKNDKPIRVSYQSA